MPQSRPLANILIYYAPQSRQSRLNMHDAPGFQIQQTDSFSHIPTLLSRHSFDLLVLAGMRPDQTQQRLAGELARRTSMGVLLLLPAEDVPAAFDALSEQGVWVMQSPMPPAVLYQLLKNLLVQRRLLCSERRSNAAMQEELADLKLIQRAKLLLMQRLQMTEAQAHRYLEKSAMDRSMPRRDVARNIIRTYDY